MRRPLDGAIGGRDAETRQTVLLGHCYLDVPKLTNSSSAPRDMPPISANSRTLWSAIPHSLCALFCRTHKAIGHRAFSFVGLCTLPFLIVLLGGIVQPIKGQTVTGRTIDANTQEPIQGAVVTLLTPGGKRVLTTQSDSLGRYAITAPVPAEYKIQARRVGYKPSRDGPFSLGASDTLSVELSVTATPVAMEDVTVKGQGTKRLREVGFYRRRKRTGGTFIDRAEIEKHDPSGLSELFRLAPGMRVLRNSRTGAGGEVKIRGGRTTDGDCRPSVAVDGAIVRQGETFESMEKVMGTPSELKLDEIINPRSVEGIEVYPRSHQAPAWLGGIQSPCGAIVIWTQTG